MKATTLMLARIIHRQTSHRVLCSNGAQSSLPCTELKQMQAIAILNLSKTLCAQTHALTRIKNCSINMKGWNLEVAYTLTRAYTSDILKLQSIYKPCKACSQGTFKEGANQHRQGREFHCFEKKDCKVEAVKGCMAEKVFAWHTDTLLLIWMCSGACGIFEVCCV